MASICDRECRKQHYHAHLTSMKQEKEYKYTLDNGFLTTEQRDFYEENGFLVIPKLVDPSHIKQYRDRYYDFFDKYH